MHDSWRLPLPESIRNRLAGRHQLARVAKNTGWMFADRVATMSAALVAGVLVARYLGPEDYGKLAYALAFVGLFAVIIPLGLNRIIIRDLVREPTSRDTILGTAFGLQAATGLLVAAAAVAASRWLNRDDVTIQWMIALIAGGYAFSAFAVINYWFQSQVQFRYTFFAKSGAYILIPLAKIALILLTAPLVYFAAAYAAQTVVIAIGLTITYYAVGQDMRRWRFNIGLARRLLADSWPLLVQGVSVTVSMRIDQILVKQIAGNEPAGLYAAAVRVSELWLFIPVIIVASAYPILIEAKERSESEYYRKLALLFRTVLLLSVSAAIVISLISYWLVYVLYGSAYLGAAPVIRVYAWSGVVSSWGVVWTRWIVIENRQKVVFVSFVISALANIVLNLILIPRYGIMGAAWATVLSYTLSLLLASLLYRPRVVGRMMLAALGIRRSGEAAG